MNDLAQLQKYSQDLHAIHAQLKVIEQTLDTEITKISSSGDESEELLALRQKLQDMCERATKAWHLVDKQIESDVFSKGLRNKAVVIGELEASTESKSPISSVASVETKLDFPDIGKSKKHSGFLGVSYDDEGKLSVTAGYKYKLFERKKPLKASSESFSIEFISEGYIEVTGKTETANLSNHSVVLGIKIAIELGVKAGIELPKAVPLVRIEGGAGFSFKAETTLTLDFEKNTASITSTALKIGGFLSLTLKPVEWLDKLLKKFKAELSLTGKWELDIDTIPLPNKTVHIGDEPLDLEFLKDSVLPPGFVAFMEVMEAVGEVLEWLDGAVGAILGWLGDLWDAVFNSKWEDLLEKHQEDLKLAISTAAQNLHITEQRKNRLLRAKKQGEDALKTELLSIVSEDPLVVKALSKAEVLKERADKLEELQANFMFGRGDKETFEKEQQDFEKDSEELRDTIEQINAQIYKFVVSYEEVDKHYDLDKMPDRINAYVAIASHTSFTADEISLSLWHNGKRVDTTVPFKKMRINAKEERRLKVVFMLPTDFKPKESKLHLECRLDQYGHLWDKVYKTPIELGLDIDPRM